MPEHEQGNYVHHSPEVELVRVFFLFFISLFLVVCSQDARKCGPRSGLSFIVRIRYSSLV